ncbi:type I-E CRISPR-associated protein Cas5/CasD [Nocardiopsis sp. FR6]|uniref:type I-E CRISPR-associated protein Cas5/CasD n=1 Tax=Nocardiopsis sp. FR6 TaxID=2605986 RepID=UPI001357570D|nr:type I-E CRISPR-associated protein Cas5/CasD [Nocardiopsis sp. FR6]
MNQDQAVLLLRLAGPLQAWATRPEYGRRETQGRPTKSGVLGLLAAAQGRPRGEDITDLVGLTMAVRVDQAGELLRDYHTTSDHRGIPLPSTQVNAKGEQKLTSPAKSTYVTQRFYLQDAVFVVALAGPAPLIAGLTAAVRNPAFPLALGRRSCPPTQPVLLTPPDQAEPGQDLESVLATVPWQASPQAHQTHQSRKDPQTVRLQATIEDSAGEYTEEDVPISFTIGMRTRGQRRVRHTWVSAPTGLTPSSNPSRPREDDAHDPFELLGW